MNNRRRMMMTAQGGKPPEPPFYVSGYVGNGMVYTFDTLENAGEGEARYTSGYKWADLQNKTEYSVGVSAYWSPWGASNKYYNSSSYRHANGSFTTTEPFLDISQPFTVEVRCQSARDSGSANDNPGTSWQQFGGCVLVLGKESKGQNGGCQLGGNGVIEFCVYANSSTGENKGMQIFVGDIAGEYGYCSFRPLGFVQTSPHTYSVSYDGAGKLKFYGDGVLVGEQTVGGTFYNNQAKWWRSNGNAVSQANSSYFIGTDYRFSVYQKCLTDDEILSNYQNDIARYA